MSPARLDEQQVSELVRAMRDGEPARELERRVYLESEGLPLFVAEYLAALRAGEGAEESLPGEVRSLLGARLGNLSEVAHQVLGAAAVVGRSFELDTVREVSGRSDEEAVAALEELVAQGVVRELTGAEPAYDFCAREAAGARLRADDAGAPAPPARAGRSHAWQGTAARASPRR